MNSSAPLLRHRFIQELGKRQSNRKGTSGFTLIELLIVVIIVGILSAVALPAFLNQSNRAKASAAKSLVSSLAKECQVALVEGSTSSFAQTVTGTSEVTLVNGSTPSYAANPGLKDATCSPTAANAYSSAIVGSDSGGTGSSWTITLTTSGAVSKSCTGTNGCDNLKW